MFLYTKENALDLKICNGFIQTFEKSDEKKPGALYGPEGTSSESGKKSTDISFSPKHLKDHNWNPLLTNLIPVLEKGLSDYMLRHKVAMDNMDPCTISPVFNMQRYLPGEGFSTWHCERATVKYNNRLLVWMIHLNTVTDRGETEFFYQHHFESPVAGKLSIWPSDWMYLHRGVISPTEPKYILTGWYTQLDRE